MELTEYGLRGNTVSPAIVVTVGWVRLAISPKLSSSCCLTVRSGLLGIVNGIDTDALRGVMDEVRESPEKGRLSFRVKSEWQGQAASVSRSVEMILGGEAIARDVEILADEPEQLLGKDSAPNPQELLLAAMNACMMVGYVVGAAVRGIKLSSLSIETSGELDLRGFLGLDPLVKPGYDTLHYKVRIAGDGTQEDYEAIHNTVRNTSPNRFNLGMPINLDAELIVES
ncbi:MAG: OsmC family protein [Myxococcota bacterium]